MLWSSSKRVVSGVVLGGDFVNLQESNAGFGDTQDLASLDLRQKEPRMFPVREQPLTQEFMKEFEAGIKEGVRQALGDGLSGFSMKD